MINMLRKLMSGSFDKCTKVAILWFCFVAHAVEQLGNELPLFCYHSFRIFIMQRRNFWCFTPLVAEFFHPRNILLFCYSATSVAEFFSSEKFSAILLLYYLSSRIFLICEKHLSASAIIVKLCQQSYYDYLFGVGGGWLKLTTGLSESSLC